MKPLSPPAYLHHDFQRDCAHWIHVLPARNPSGSLLNVTIIRSIWILTIEDPLKGPLGWGDIIGISNHGWVAIVHVRPFMERIVCCYQLIVWTPANLKSICATRSLRDQPRADLIFGAIIRSRMKMARRVGLNTITPHLHIPKESLPKFNNLCFVGDKLS